MKGILSGGPRDGEEREIPQFIWNKKVLILPVERIAVVFEKYDGRNAPPPPLRTRERYELQTITDANGLSIQRWVYKGAY